jgi:hypothetical protein
MRSLKLALPVLLLAGVALATVSGAGSYWLGNNLFLVMGTSSTPAQPSTTPFVDTTARNPATCAGNVDFANPYSVVANALSATGKGVRFHFEGTTANNAAAKTIRVMWGSQAIVSKQLGISIAGTWEIEGECYKSGSNTQQCSAKAWNHGTVAGTVSGTDGAAVLLQDATLSGTQTDTSAISLRVQEVTCTTNTDITQTLARVSFDN